MSAIYECECDSFEMYEEQDSFEMAEAVPGPGVPSGGLTGQVLKKRSDEDFDTEWADDSGGGGGTSDYTQLSNKPQINGITLSGNKSGSDLGLVNAETGKGLSTNDYTTADKNKLSGIEAQANKTVIDSTLTNAGQAADAKAVGDEISQLKSDVQDLQGDLAGLDAGDVAYDNSLTYAAGTVGKELGEQRNTLTQLGNDIATILQDPAQDTFAEGTYVFYNNQLYTVNQGGIPMDTPASSYYPNMLTAVPDGGLNSVYTTILSRFSGIEVPYFGVFIAGGTSYDFQLRTGWSTYLVFSTYSGRFGVWMLISANGDNAKLSGSYNGLTFTNVGSGIIRISANDTACITIVRIGVS